ncbi:hypothetical protein DFH09DRAFT_1272594 [Mycena vulgaris]|nr:hypothetical protein DFH09DRAFT_1272594 [Mycena vulgaris]
MSRTSSATTGMSESERQRYSAISVREAGKKGQPHFHRIALPDGCGRCERSGYSTKSQRYSAISVREAAKGGSAAFPVHGKGQPHFQYSKIHCRRSGYPTKTAISVREAAKGGSAAFPVSATLRAGGAGPGSGYSTRASANILRYPFVKRERTATFPVQTLRAPDIRPPGYTRCQPHCVLAKGGARGRDIRRRVSGIPRYPFVKRERTAAFPVQCHISQYPSVKREGGSAAFPVQCQRYFAISVREAAKGGRVSDIYHLPGVSRIALREVRGDRDIRRRVSDILRAGDRDIRVAASADIPPYPFVERQCQRPLHCEQEARRVKLEEPKGPLRARLTESGRVRTSRYFETSLGRPALHGSGTWPSAVLRVGDGIGTRNSREIARLQRDISRVAQIQALRSADSVSHNR